VRTHQEIEERSLALAKAIVEKIDRDPARCGLEKARATCLRWHQQRPAPGISEWLRILDQPWEKIRVVLLDEGEEGRRLRQNDPFCGILTPQERWAIYCAHYESRRS
jgi:hypothetical protein